MELQLIEGSQEKLIHGLKYIPNAQASYLKDRANVSYFPVGGNNYSPSGVRLLRFELTASGDDFLDPGSVRLAFTIVNAKRTEPGSKKSSPLAVSSNRISLTPLGE